MINDPAYPQDGTSIIKVGKLSSIFMDNLFPGSLLKPGKCLIFLS
jgi:hypothetical protein